MRNIIEELYQEMKEVKGYFELFQKLAKDGNLEDKKKIGKLVVFSGLSRFPLRIKCALLPWETMVSVILRYL